jgi:hypothetical protein
MLRFMKKIKKMLKYLSDHVLQSMLFDERSDFERKMRSREWAHRRLEQMTQKERQKLWKKICKEK